MTLQQDIVDACKRYVDKEELDPHAFTEKVLTAAVHHWLQARNHKVPWPNTEGVPLWVPRSVAYHVPNVS
jgi:hypothetical protein